MTSAVTKAKEDPIERELALVDVLARDAAAAEKALDVFVRRLAPTSVKRETRARG